MEEESFDERRLKRESVGSRKIILRVDGSEETPFDYYRSDADPLLKAFVQRDFGINSSSIPSPTHIDVMQNHELVNYEPASDIGHFRFAPKGALMKDLLEDLAEDIAIRRLGAVKIHTPLLYRAEQPDIADQAASFHERDYKVDLGDRQLILRFAGDFGLFSMMKDAKTSHRNLPVRVYEISSSFRFEKSGECSGLKRLRAFTMPDIHCFCGDMNQALEEYASLYKFYDSLLKEADLPFAVAFRVVDEFWKEHKDFLESRINCNCFC